MERITVESYRARVCAGKSAREEGYPVEGFERFSAPKGKEGLSCEINKDFYNTEDGIARKDGQSFEAAPADPTKHAIRNHVRGSSEAWNMIFPFPKMTNSTMNQFNCL